MSKSMWDTEDYPEEKPQRPPKRADDGDDSPKKSKKKELTKPMRAWILAQRKHHHGQNQDRFAWSDLEDILL